jgi:hypothetical protein
MTIANQKQLQTIIVSFSGCWLTFGTMLSKLVEGMQRGEDTSNNKEDV